MPTADQHRIKAEQNRRFLDAVSLDDHPDWVVVAAFYAAVHTVERLRAVCGHGHSGGHEDRSQYVQLEHPDIDTEYRTLLHASMLARYHSNAEFFAHFQREDIRDRLVGRFLATIEEYVRDRLTPPPPPAG